MNFKEKILDLNHQHTEKFEIDSSNDIDDVLLTIICKYQLFEPCQYLSEDDEWINVAAISLENEDMTQALSVRKDQITTLGIYVKEPEDDSVNPPSEDFYQ